MASDIVEECRLDGCFLGAVDFAVETEDQDQNLVVGEALVAAVGVDVVAAVVEVAVVVAAVGAFVGLASKLVCSERVNDMPLFGYVAYLFDFR